MSTTSNPQLIPLPSETRIQTGFTHKMIISYADLLAAGAVTTATIAMLPYAPPPYYAQGAIQQQAAGQLGAGICIERAAVYGTTLFTGPALSAMKVDVGDGGSVGRYIANANTDLFTAGTGNTHNPVIGSTAYVYTAADAAANSQVQVKFTSTGCNMGVLTGGQVEIYVKVSDLTALAKVIEPGTP